MIRRRRVKGTISSPSFGTYGGKRKAPAGPVTRGGRLCGAGSGLRGRSSGDRWWRGWGRGRPPRCGGDGRHHIVVNDATAFARPLHVGKIDIFLARELANRRRRGRGRACVRRGWRIIGSRGQSCADLRGFVDLADRITDGDDVIFGREQLRDDTCHRSRQLTVGLVGENLDDGFVLRDELPHRDEPFANRAFYDAFAELRHGHFGGHRRRTIAQKSHRGSSLLKFGCLRLLASPLLTSVAPRVGVESRACWTLSTRKTGFN